MQDNESRKMAGANAVAGESKKKPMPVVLRVLSVLGGLIMIGVGILQMSSGIKELTSDGLPTETERAAVAKQALASMAQFKNASGTFSMDYPSTWERSEKVEPPMIFHVATYKGTVNLSVTEEDEPKDVGSAEYAKATDEAIAKTTALGNLKKLEETEISLNGTPAHKRIHLIGTETKDGKQLQIRQIMVLACKGGKGYCITGSVLADWLPQFEPVFNKMIDSIKIGG